MAIILSGLLMTFSLAFGFVLLISEVISEKASKFKHQVRKSI